MADLDQVREAWFWEDMAYKTTPLISPALTRRYMLAWYKWIVDFLVWWGVPKP